MDVKCKNDILLGIKCTCGIILGSDQLPGNIGLKDNLLSDLNF